MNRRGLLTGAAALAASSVVPVALAQRRASSEALEFVSTVMALSPEKKVIFASMMRRWPEAFAQELATIVEGIAAKEAVAS